MDTDTSMGPLDQLETSLLTQPLQASLKKTTDRWTRNTGRLPSFPYSGVYKVNPIILSLSYSTSVIAYLKYFNFKL